MALLCTTVASFAQVADIVVDKQGPPVATAGSTVDYTIFVTNNGPNLATIVNVFDQLPPGMTVVNVAITPAIPPETANCNPLPNNLAIQCTIAAMPAAPAAGSTMQVSVIALIDQNVADGTQLVNGAEASDGIESDPAGFNNRDQVTTTVHNAADLSVTKTASTAAPAPGSTITYTVTVTNNEPLFLPFPFPIFTPGVTSRDVVLRDYMPAGTTITGITSTQGNSRRVKRVTAGSPRLVPWVTSGLVARLRP